jgi:SAM-dependent methyltransferase
MSDDFTRHNRWQYSTADLLQARIETHQKYSERNDWAAWLAAQLPQTIEGRWLDVGSGDGTMLTALASRVPHQQLFALDQSAGMLAANRQKTAAASGGGNVAYVNGEAENLPFAAAGFALVTANHMLYHVPDIGRAVTEAARVLQPGGTFVATTNVRQNYQELGELRRKGILALGINIPPPTDANGPGRFSLEDGMTYIAPYFPNVRTVRHDDALLFTDVDGVMRYLLSGPLYSGTPGPEDAAVSPQQWQQLADWIALRVERIILKYSAFRVSKAAGAFVATKLTLVIKYQPRKRGGLSLKFLRTLRR